jgi:hypothetical protein
LPFALLTLCLSADRFDNLKAPIGVEFFKNEITFGFASLKRV